MAVATVVILLAYRFRARLADYLPARKRKRARTACASMAHPPAGTGGTVRGLFKWNSRDAAEDAGHTIKQHLPGPSRFRGTL